MRVVARDGMLAVESAIDRGTDGRQRAAASGGRHLQDEKLRHRVPKAVEVLPKGILPTVAC